MRSLGIASRPLTATSVSFTWRPLAIAGASVVTTRVSVANPIMTTVMSPFTLPTIATPLREMATRKQKIQRRLRGIKKGPATQPSKAVTVDEGGVVKGGVSTMQVKVKKVKEASVDPMADRLKRFKPTTPSQRHRVHVVRPYLWKGRPIRALTRILPRTGGRGHRGHICMRHRGGGHKRRYRFIDFKRSIHDQPGVIQRFEYDPNRSCNIALVTYPGGEMTYIIAPQELKVGDTILASRKNEIDLRVGNAMPLHAMPIGTFMHNIEMTPGRGGQIARSAGTSCQLLEKNIKPGYALVRLQSKEQRLLQLNCMATIGVVSNPLHKHRVLGKAGRSRWLGIRPHVRGTVMNPVDHPHGGGEGRGGVGRPSVSPTAVLAKGYRTRDKKKSKKWILVRRGGAQAGESGISV